mgnify:CR=1 FL=1
MKKVLMMLIVLSVFSSCGEHEVVSESDRSQLLEKLAKEKAVLRVKNALENENISGAVNTVAPECIQMKDFCNELGKVINRPSWAPVPVIALKILLGEMADMLLGGQHVIPEKLIKNGYDFCLTIFPLLIP